MARPRAVGDSAQECDRANLETKLGKYLETLELLNINLATLFGRRRRQVLLEASGFFDAKGVS